MPAKNNMTIEQVNDFLNKDAPEVYSILNKPVNEVFSLIKTFSEEMLTDLISIDKRKAAVTNYTHRLNFLTRYADLDYLIKRYLKGDVGKREVCSRMNMSDRVLDCAIEVYQRKDRGRSVGRPKKTASEFSINKRLHNVAWGASMKIETHWYIPYHMYETLI